MKIKDPYKILCVDRNASKDIIRKSYKHLVKIYHPDGRNPDREKFENIQDAYKLLQNKKEKPKIKIKKPTVKTTKTVHKSYNNEAISIYKNIIKDFEKKNINIDFNKADQILNIIEKYIDIDNPKKRNFYINKEIEKII